MKYSVPVSVIMPCYNYGNYVGDAIDSILAQTMDNFELIIINDGSTDNSDRIIRSYTDPRIRYICLNENIGNYPCRNRGVDLARGKYIAVMDADDVACKDRLKIQFNYMEAHPKHGGIGSQGEWMSESGILSGRRVNKPVVPRAHLQVLLLMNNFTLHPSLMLRSSFLEKHHLRYNENYRYAADFDFVARFSFVAPIQNIENVLIRYRVHNTQISSRNAIEQVQFADRIRLSQLSKFMLQLDDYEQELYLHLMNNKVFNNIQSLEGVTAILNRILLQNEKLKIYNHKFLFEFFGHLLLAAKNNLIRYHRHNSEIG